MIEYFVLNAASIPFPTQEMADEELPKFFKLLQDAFKESIQGILVSGELEHKWFEIMVAPDIPFHSWLKGKDEAYRRRLKSFVSKSQYPIIKPEDNGLLYRFEYSNFYLADAQETDARSPGAAFLLGQLSLSWTSHDRWCVNPIRLIHIELRGEVETEEEVSVENCFDWDGWTGFKERIQQERTDSLRQSGELWAERETRYPHLEFCGAAVKQVKNLRVNQTVFRQFTDVLDKLNRYCEGDHNFSMNSIRDETGFVISDESDTVKQVRQLRRGREHRVGDIKVFFGWHIKSFSAAIRLHFYPQTEEKKIYIGYFGKHLPTATNR